MQTRPVLRRKDLLYPELSYKINGVLFDVAKQLGGGHQEKYYQKAIRLGLQENGIKFREQVYVPVQYNGKIVGKYYLDFLVDDKIAIEVKRGEFIASKVVQQTQQYLTALNLKLGIVACFTHGGVVVKRVANEY